MSERKLTEENYARIRGAALDLYLREQDADVERRQLQFLYENVELIEP